MQDMMMLDKGHLMKAPSEIHYKCKGTTCQDKSFPCLIQSAHFLHNIQGRFPTVPIFAVFDYVD